MRQAQIYRKNILAGLLTEEGGEYIFRYDSDYLTSPKAAAISLTLPLQQEAYTSPVLFPFFDGLIPEGWLLDVALRNTDIQTFLKGKELKPNSLKLRGQELPPVGVGLLGI